MSYLILFLSWAVFYFSHSYLASLKIKRNIHRLMDKQYKWYRFFYSTISFLMFLGIFLYAATIPPELLFAPGGSLEYFALMLSGIGTIILIKSFKYFGAIHFIGLPPFDDLHEEQQLIIKGIHKHLRHPIYLGLIFIFLGYFLFLPTIASLIHLTALVIYIPIGIYFEEKKLITIFGQAYLDYKEEVPAIIPKFTQ
jgi:methanethiol S-methyltransferase